MKREHIGASIAATLVSPSSIIKWRSDPLAYVEQAGLTLSHLDDYSREVFRNHLANTQIQILTGPWCLGCKILVGGTIVGLSAALVVFVGGLVVGTGGADLPAAPEEVVAGSAVEIAAVAAETGLTLARVGEVILTVLRGIVAWAKANPAKAAAFVAAGTFAVGEIVSAICEALCKACNACSD